MPIFPPDNFYLSANNQDKFIQEFTPLSENLVYSSALSLNYQVAFMVLLVGQNIKLVGSFGLDIEGFKPKEIFPTWLLPTRVEAVNNHAQLNELGLLTGFKTPKNALGISIVMPHGIVGALWYMNSLAPSQEITPRQNQMIKVFAHQVSLCLKRQSELFEMQQPHKIARERDSLLAIAHSLPLSVILKDPTGVIQFVNSAFTKQFGYLPEEVLQQPIQRLVHVNYHPAIQEAMAARAKGQSTVYRYQMIRKDQSLAEVEVIGHPHYDSNGKAIGHVIILRDISEEIALEQATLEARRAINKKLKDTLQDTQRLLETEKNFALEILETLQDGFALLNNEGKFEFVNPAFASLGGTIGKSFIGLDAMQFSHPDDLIMVRQKLRQLKPKQVESFQLRVVIRDGQLLHLSVHASLRLNPKGVAVGVLISARDITETLESQAKVAKLELQIENTQEKLVIGEGFSGRLENVGGTVGLLQMVAASPVNGAISLDDAKLFLLNGRVVAVEHHLLDNEEAVANLVQRQQGQFQFIPNLRPEKTMFNLDPVKLALEYLTKEDEQTATRQHVVTVPNSIAAKAFVSGVGGMQHFRVLLEQNQVVLSGRGLKVIVMQAQISDFSV